MSLDLKPLDLANTEAWQSGDILPAGRHTVKVMEAAETTSSGGHPQLELQLEAIGGDCVGGQIRDWITFTAEAAGRVKQVLGAFGVDSSKDSLDATELVGAKANILVREEPYDGKMRSKVKAYEPASEVAAASANGGTPKPDDDDLPF